MYSGLIQAFHFEKAKPYWQQMASQMPLIHCMTNPVAMNLSANVLLASGASPAMVLASQEVGTFTPHASNLLINVGTLNDHIADAMLEAAKTALIHGKRWVLDPVAVGDVLMYRTDFVHQLLKYQPTVIRGNAAEILYLAGKDAVLHGTESVSSPLEALNSAIALAKRYDCVVAVTGEHDYITDGNTIYKTYGGDIRQTQVTACGCALSALTAAFVANQPILEGAAAACAVMKHAGDYAAQSNAGMGSFAVRLLDALTFENSLHE